jgi:hypothetical protein
MTIYLTNNKVQRLLTEAINQALNQYLSPTIVPIPNNEPTPNSSDDDDDKLPPLAPAPAKLTLSIPLIPSFPKAVEDAFNSSCIADDALQHAVPAFASTLQARPTPSCYAPCTQTTLLCTPCAPTEIYIDIVVGSFSTVFSSIS